MFKYLLAGIYLMMASSMVFAQFDWRDPTQPARYSFNVDGDLPEGEFSSEPSDSVLPEAVVEVGEQSFNLRQIIVGDERRFAKINDILLKVGDEILGYQVNAIESYHVDLVKDEETKTVYLFRTGLKEYQD